LAKRASQAEAGGGEQPNGGPQADVLGDFAADLGKFLGGVQSRATSWLQQRKDIAEQLTRIRDTADQYLRQLGGGERVTTPSMLAKEVEKRQGKRRGRPPGSRNAKPAAPETSPAPEEAATQPARKKRFMSEEARARIADAQRKRWAKLRRGTRNANR
jgi:hypothetical protein